MLRNIAQHLRRARRRNDLSDALFMTRNKPVRLPPLPSLRAFEAVARLKSVRDAAQELGLTPSAVSHQLRNLEDHLGVALFNRGNQSIELTDTGAQFAVYAERAFRELRQGVAALRSNLDSNVLRVSVAPLFAMEILLPALPDFERACPDLQLRLDVGESLADLDTESIDAAIRIGVEPTNSVFHEMLLEVRWAPVCAPRLLQGPNALRNPSDLGAHALIESNENNDSSPWQMWLDAAGLADLKPANKLRFDTFLGTLQATESGLGVTVAPLSIVARHFAEGRLAMPFALTIPSPWSYRLVCRRGQERQPKVDRFRRWLKGICSAHATLLPQRCGERVPLHVVGSRS
jgi:LysR family transcriptional regulator, glycine cleavage system transcriptional activator